MVAIWVSVDRHPPRSEYGMNSALKDRHLSGMGPRRARCAARVERRTRRSGASGGSWPERMGHMGRRVRGLLGVPLPC